jgi:hypothetical protein
MTYERACRKIGVKPLGGSDGWADTWKPYKCTKCRNRGVVATLKEYEARISPIGKRCKDCKDGWIIEVKD